MSNKIEISTFSLADCLFSHKGKQIYCSFEPENFGIDVSFLIYFNDANHVSFVSTSLLLHYQMTTSIMTISQEHQNLLHKAYPALSVEWLQSLLKLGHLKSRKRGEFIAKKGDPTICVFIISGVVIAEDGPRTGIYGPGQCLGLRETFFSANLPDIQEFPYSGKEVKKVDLNFLSFQENYKIISKGVEYIEIQGGEILQCIANTPSLRETWLYLLNKTYEDEMQTGLQLFHKSATERLREVLDFIRKNADEATTISVKNIQALTGISRSSMYRSLKELQQKRELVLCENGMVGFQPC